ncbi:CubicO group peptidase, beta-lactamase class C family [Pseudoxanthomonas sp. GM95]|uniref:serine hydrolase domain-containing protein n=1 Tax=Pseudoxanthomonas sp. GM95 TaxID=1881043 RepID=UPI0008B47FD8|nr:serine hydrolase [Pseudoxanthomonas sp. GM95]SEM09574.1 CubicO group peptidase, beta-lactamase class C family [Pseudoxanthomonas sp. GM95]
MKALLHTLLWGWLWAVAMPLASAAQTLPQTLDGAATLPNLRTVIVAQHGKMIAERGYHGGAVDRPANIKSASKTVVAALVGIAIDKGVLEGVDQPIAPLLKGDLPPNPDPRLAKVTIGQLLSMQAGLARTSGPNYGRWVGSRNWVRYVLAQPFVDDPGGGMLYSTGSTHLLSAILTRATGKSTLQLSKEWLGPQPGFAITAWARDPQGVYFGGNQMSMTPRSLWAFGELFRNGGRSSDGKALISPRWIDAAWAPRTHSVFTGDGYGYGWFARRIGARDVRFAWGYGGQMLYVVPSLDLVVVMTSDPDQPSGSSGYLLELHALLGKLMAAPELATR